MIETSSPLPAIQGNGDDLATGYVDLRSDTVTRPTAAMRRAMAEAEVGDDYFREDPTVRALEEETAALLGKEAALFVPTGSMGNEIAIAAQTRRGDAIVCDRFCHVATTEERSVVDLLGRELRPLDAARGRIVERDLPDSAGGVGDGARVGLVEVENTHNWRGGVVYPLPELLAIGRAARRRGWPLHLDGARLWNASAASGVTPAEYAAAADSVMVCYSKGLGAPVGSAVAGPKAFLEDALGAREMFGGAMRQSGIVAAGALHALRHHRPRLAEDHARAKRLAGAIALTPGLSVDPDEVETNIVIAEVVRRPERFDAFLEAVKAEGVLLYPFGGPSRFRAATHLDVDDAGIERAIAAIRAAAAAVLGP